MTNSRAAALCLGASVGAAGSLVGMGGSFLALPIIINFFRVHTPQLAVGTGMATVLGTSIGGTLGYIMRNDSFRAEFENMIKNNSIPVFIGDVDVLSAGSLALSSSVTVILGARTSKKLNGQSLRYIVGIFLLSMAPLVPGREAIKNWIEKSRPATSVTSTADQKKVKAIRSFGIGTFSGFLAGLLGVGGGAVVVPALSLFTDLPYSVALGTSLGAMIPTAVIGSLTHFRQGTMIPRLAVPLGLGSCFGSYVTAIYCKKIEEKNLQYGFALVVGVLGCQTLVQALRMARP